MLSGDHLITVREAVADTQKQGGFAHLAEATLKGEADQLPMMQAAATAVERVLRTLPCAQAAPLEDDAGFVWGHLCLAARASDPLGVAMPMPIAEPPLAAERIEAGLQP